MVVLIIGLGSIASKHIQVIKKINPDCALYALRSSLNPEKIPEVKNIYSLDQIDFQPDFILISSPTSNHYHDIEECLRFNCPLFIEKPVIGSLKEYQKLSDKLLIHNIRTYVACVLRFHPCVQFVKKNKSSLKKINEVNVYCGSYLPEWRPNQNYKNSYSANESMGGGIHLDMIHELDYIYWLFGRPDFSQSFFSARSSLRIESVDYANYIFAYSDFNVSIILNYYRRMPRRTLELIGEEDTWTIDLIKYQIKDQNDTIIFNSNKTIMDLYEAQMNYFINSIQANIPYENNFEQGIEVLKLCLENNYVKR